MKVTEALLAADEFLKLVAYVLKTEADKRYRKML